MHRLLLIGYAMGSIAGIIAAAGVSKTDYKSVLCQEDIYPLKPIRYIHLLIFSK
jgi:hypothetical protein